MRSDIKAIPFLLSGILAAHIVVGYDKLIFLTTFANHIHEWSVLGKSIINVRNGSSCAKINSYKAKFVSCRLVDQGNVHPNNTLRSQVKHVSFNIWMTMPPT